MRLPVNVTLTAGVAGQDGRVAGSGGELMAWADSALYSAKRAGKNQVHVVNT